MAGAVWWQPDGNPHQEHTATFGTLSFGTSEQRLSAKRGQDQEGRSVWRESAKGIDRRRKRQSGAGPEKRNPGRT